MVGGFQQPQGQLQILRGFEEGLAPQAALIALASAPSGDVSSASSRHSIGSSFTRSPIAVMRW